jgi:hypothetical protein
MSVIFDYCKIQEKELTVSVLWPILEHCPFILVNKQYNGKCNTIMYNIMAYLHYSWLKKIKATFIAYSFPAMAACSSCLLTKKFKYP